MYTIILKCATLLSLILTLGLNSYGQETKVDFTIDGLPISEETAEKHIKEGKIQILTWGCGASYGLSNIIRYEVRQEFGFKYLHISIPGGGEYWDMANAYNERMELELAGLYGENWDKKVEDRYTEKVASYSCLNKENREYYLTKLMTIYFPRNSYDLTNEAKCILDSIYIPFFENVFTETSDKKFLFIGSMDSLERLQDSTLALKRAYVYAEYLSNHGVKINKKSFRGHSSSVFYDSKTYRQEQSWTSNLSAMFWMIRVRD